MTFAMNHCFYLFLKNSSDKTVSVEMFQLLKTGKTEPEIACYELGIGDYTESCQHLHPVSSTVS